MVESRQETLWVISAQLGSREALGSLFEAVQAPLSRYLANLAGDWSVAEDILQEVFLRIHRKIGWLDDPALFRPWCYRVATNEAFRRLRKDRRWADQVRDVDVLASVAAEPDERPAEPDLLARLPALLARVSPASRVVLVLHYLDGLTLGEAADVLGVSVGTVKSRLAYGLRLLRSILAETQEPQPAEKNVP